MYFNVDYQIIELLIVLAIMVVFFTLELLPMEVTALATIGALWFLGILTIEEAISGFGNKAVVTIGAIFIISRSLVKTGFLEVVTDYFYNIGGNWKWFSFSIFFIAVSLISGFINNTAAVAIFIPLAINLCQRFHISPTKILLPLSYAAIYGGTLTLIGTSTNLIVNSYLESHSLPTFTMFEFTKLGLIFLCIGTVYNLFISRWILPSRAITSSLTQKYHMRTFLTEFKITEESILNGSNIKKHGIRENFDVQILKIIRDKKEIIENIRYCNLMKDDILICQINVKDIIKFKDNYKLLLLSEIKIDQNELAGENFVIVEGLIPANSYLINKTIGSIDFRNRFGSFVLAIKRQTELLRDKVAYINMKFSDTLLIMVPKKKLEMLKTSNDLIILEELDIHLRYQKYWWLSILIFPIIMFLTSFNFLSITEATVIGAIILLVLRSLSIEEAYESINWPVIFLIALLVPIGIAMEKTGTGYYLSEWIVEISKVIGPTPDIQAIRIISILYFITFITSAFVSNAAVAIILSPLAIILGQYFYTNFAIDPTRAFLMAVCFGASASFMTPIGYQTNLMVFAPGQYRFKDFLIVGLPLTIIFWIVASMYIPQFWPF
tara:strand:- start:936 stop:2759 length:1824 start_codon:yes stop_codon:yes gene_type:complete